MATCKILHNPRCSKSRQALALLEAHGVEAEVRRYLDEPLSVAELKDLAKRLNCHAMDMMRRNDKRYSELGLDKDTTTEPQRFTAIANHPQLLERPIVIVGTRAVIARPPEKLLELV